MQASFDQGSGDFRHPLDFPVPLGQFNVVISVEMETVAACIFCCVTSYIGTTHDVGDIAARAGDGYNTDAHSNATGSRPPIQIRNRIKNDLCNTFGLLERTVLLQDTKFVPS